jgi:hypothetical protein
VGASTKTLVTIIDELRSSDETLPLFMVCCDFDRTVSLALCV